MVKDIGENIKSRNWIKGHFYEGTFYGVVFGTISGLFIFRDNVYFSIIAVLSALCLRFIMNSIEEASYNKK